jgi:IS30 family transposase
MPAHIERREQPGYWEVDTVVSRQSGVCAAVPVERKSRFYIVILMKDKSTHLMWRVNELGTKSYFCKPYHSREKGSIENRNDIL